MKRNIISYISVAAVCCTASVACSDFLTEELQTDYSSKTFYTSAANAERAVNGIYNNIMFTSDQNMLWVFGDVASDDSEKGGSAGDKSDIDYINNFSAMADNGILGDYWTYLYEGVARANNAIAYIPGIQMDEELKSRLIGEAKFLRALNYFHIVNIWGAVPLRTEPNAADNGNLALSDVETVYAKIESDLSDVIASTVPISYSGEDAGRVTQGAAYALRAKVHLFRQNWGACLSDIESLEALHQYELAESYQELFVPGAEDNKEVIFAARHLSGQNPGLGNILNVYFAPSVETGYYFNAPTQSFVDCFNEQTEEGETDPRLDISIGRPGQPWVNGDTFDASWSPTGYLVKKYEQPLSEVPVGTKSDGYLPYIYLRYADVLLMKAEALIWTKGEGDAEAKQLLNRIRKRARLEENSTATKAELKNQRRCELAFEFMPSRHLDMVRWGDAKEAYAEPTRRVNSHWDSETQTVVIDEPSDYDQGRTFDPVINQVFPIPVTAFNGTVNLKQNIGY